MVRRIGLHDISSRGDKPVKIKITCLQGMMRRAGLHIIFPYQTGSKVRRIILPLFNVAALPMWVKSDRWI